MKEASGRLEKELAGKHGEEARPRLARGLKQVAEFWRAEDGDAAAFEEFVRTNFAGDAKTLDALFDRMEFALESLDGHMLEIGRDFRKQSDLDLGPIYPFDETLAGYDPSAHVTDDFFANKLAFVGAANFPLTTLEERLAEGEKWSRRQWAEARLAERFSKRIPAEVNLAIGRAAAAGRAVHRRVQHLDAPPRRRQGTAALPAEAAAALALEPARRDQGGLRGRRGRASPSSGRSARSWSASSPRRSPTSVVNNPQRGLEPVHQRGAAGGREGRRRAGARRAARPATRPSPTRATRRCSRPSRRRGRPIPTRRPRPRMIARRFDEDREIPEARVRKMLEEVLSSPLVPRGRGADREAPRPAARALRHLVRGLQAARRVHRGASSTRSCARSTRPRRPTRRTSRISCVKLGFSKERAEFLARQHRRRSGARLRPRHGRRHAAATRRTCARASRRTA